MDNLVIYCADIGSVKKNNFGWARVEGMDVFMNNDIALLAVKVAGDLVAGKKVALGFECPLFIPITPDPQKLTAARNGEGNRAWCAGAGAGALATGLSETVWILDRIRQIYKADKPELPMAFLDWTDFIQAEIGLFVWEAFVSGESGKSDKNAHKDDARLAAISFQCKLKNTDFNSEITCEYGTRSLIGAAFLQTGWSSDISILSKACMVIKGSSDVV